MHTSSYLILLITGKKCRDLQGFDTRFIVFFKQQRHIVCYFAGLFALYSRFAEQCFDE